MKNGTRAQIFGVEMSTQKLTSNSKPNPPRQKVLFRPVYTNLNSENFSSFYYKIYKLKITFYKSIS